MSRFYLPGGTAAQLDATTLGLREIAYDLTNLTVRFGDGVTPGGLAIATPASALAASALDVTTRVFGKVPAGTVLGGSQSKAATGNGAKAAAFVTPAIQSIRMPYTGGSGRRHIADMLRDPGVSIESYMTNGAYMDAFAAALAALKAGVRRLLFPRCGYRWDSIMPDSVCSNRVFAGGHAGGPGSPTTVFAIDNTRSMWSLGSTVHDVTFEGTHVWEYHDAPVSTSLYAFILSGVQRFFADTLVIRNCARGLYIGGAAGDIYIRHLHVEGAVALVVAAGVTRVRIGRITGTGTVSIASGADCIIGADVGATLGALSSLTLAPGKAIVIDATGAASLIDWITSGSWAPTISCVTPGDLSVAISGVTTTLRKEDKTVRVSCVIVFTPTYTAASGIAGAVVLGGLPYVASSGTALARLELASSSAFTWPTSVTDVFFQTQANQAFAYLVGKKPSSTNPLAVPMTAFPSGQPVTLRITGSYPSAT